MKKRTKIFLFTLLSILSISSVNARQMDINELGNRAKDLKKDNINYIYVIGEYAFTSAYKLTTEDIMNASRSIHLDTEYNGSNQKEVLSKMNIQQVGPKIQNWQITGWEVRDNIVGKTKLNPNEKINIRFIDYTYIKDLFTVTLETDGNDYQKSLTIEEDSKIDKNFITGNNRPTKAGKQFKEWVTEDNKPWNFNDPVKGNIKLKATWYEEVNTDTLLQETFENKTEDFGEEFKNKELIYNIFDVNKKNSEIDESELVKTLKEILGKEHVKAITITYNGKPYNIEASSISNDTDAKNKIKELLKAITGKEFTAMVLGDLLNKELTITVTLDETVSRSQNYNTQENYTVKFQYNAKSTLSKEIPEGEKQELLDKYNYSVEEDKYDIQGSNGNYKVSGYVTERKDVTGFGSSSATHYFAYTIELDSDVTNVTVKIPKGPNPGDGYNEATKTDFKDGKLTVLMEVEDNEQTKYRDIIVEIDDKPVKIRIDFTNLKLEKTSMFTVEGLEDESKFSEESGWHNTDDGYSVQVKKDDNDNAKYYVSGVLPIINDGDWSVDEFDKDQELYYLGLLLKVVNSTADFENGENDKIIIKFFHESQEIKDTQFDISSEDFSSSKKLYILKALSETIDKKEFTITVDLDGNGEIYAPYTVTIDWSGLILQKTSVAKISIDSKDIPVTDKLQLVNSWGYKFPDSISLSSDNIHNNAKLSYDPLEGKLTGTIKEQKLKGGFTGKDLDSYFYTFTIRPEEVTEDIKVTIKNSESNSKEFVYSDFKQNDKGEYVLTVLQHIPLEKNEPLKITIQIDSDGADKKGYLLSQEYTIDYSKADFVPLHTVTIQDNDGKELSKSDIYDGEKLPNPSVPTKEQHEKDDHQYNTFDHWNKKGTTEFEEETEFEFANNKSKEAITEDTTLYPIWEIDVDQYITDALVHVNEKSNVQGKFKLEQIAGTDEKTHQLKLSVLNRNTKLDEITDTAIASTIAHALASGEIETIEVELGSDDKQFKVEDNNYNESEIKTKVADGLKEFFSKEITQEEKTLHNLYEKWQSENDGLKITIIPEKKVAKLPDKESQAGMIYYVSIEETLNVTFDAGALKNPDTQYVQTHDNLENLPIPEISTEEAKYRTFDGWYKEGSQVKKLENITEDTNLTAHYTLNVDAFLDEVIKDLNSSDSKYSGDFTNKFKLEKKENNIVIHLDSHTPKVPLTELAETSIPGTIAYVLDREEIKDITLIIGSQSEIKLNKEYTSDGSKQYTDERGVLTGDAKKLKEEIIKAAKDSFDKELDEKEATTTLDQLEYAKKEFKIKIGEVKEDTITLTNSNGNIENDDAKTYTFTFASDFTVVNENNDNNLGAKLLSDAVSNDKNYSIIYIDGDVSIDTTLNLEDRNITIASIESSSLINSISEEKTKINLTKPDTDYVIDVKSGTVTIKDLKITGGKKAELKIEKDATVIVDNIDVSGTIEEPTSSEDTDEMHAHILVEGKLIVNGTITNSNESYKIPTIALVEYWMHPGIITGEEQEKGKNENIHPEASVTAPGMKWNDRYHIIKKNAKDGIDSTEETYYGKFYYINPNNSNIYYMAIKDSRKEPSNPYYKIKIYYYDDVINIKELGYEPGKSPIVGNEVFEKLVLDKREDVIVTDGTKPNELGFAAHTTNMLIAKYKQQPSAALNVQSVEGLSIGEHLSGILTKANEEGKYMIPVTLTSNKFVENKTTFIIVDPNNNRKKYTYSLTNPEGIVSAENTINLKLEAIKTSNITTDNGKKYNILVDIDGEESDTYTEETYTVDYSDVYTIVEKINNAAKNTQEATSLTVIKNNKIKDGTEHFTYAYDSQKEVTLYSENGEEKEYTFRLRSVVPSHKGPIIISVRKPVVLSEAEKGGARPKINENWEFANFFKEVTKGYHELALLQDVINKTTIESIKKVEKIDEHKYHVTLNKARLNEWLDNAYIGGSTYNESESTQKESGTTEEENVIVEVVLDTNDQYIESIKTTSTFTVTSKSKKTFDDNQIDVRFENVNTTAVSSPLDFFGKTKEEIEKYYEECKKWHHDNTGADIYEE